MGKKNSKPANGSQLSTKDSVFDESALSALTARIEKGLDQTNTPATGNAVPPTAHQGSEIETKIPRIDKSKSKGNSRVVARGIKRDANGNAKSGNQQSDATKRIKDSIPQGKDTRAVLLEEILALGGTAEDLDLVADAQSDDDAIYETGDKVDKSFKKDLAKFIEGLGIEQAVDEDDKEINEEEEEEEEKGELLDDEQIRQEEEDLETSETESLEEPLQSAAPAEEDRRQPILTNNQGTLPKDVNRLVSISSLL